MKTATKSMRCGDHEDDLFIAEGLMDISQIRDNKIGQLKNKTHKRIVWCDRTRHIVLAWLCVVRAYCMLYVVRYFWMNEKI